MTAMTPELRARALAALAHQNPAAPELVLAALGDALSVGGHSHPPLIAERLRRAERAVPAIVRRLLDIEQQAEAMRRVLAEAVVTADDLPDDGLTSGDLLTLLAAAGINLHADIEAAALLRHAEQTAGVG
jgi:hypothetical protein